MASKLKSVAGVTLIEVLIALLITGVITAAMFRVYLNQHHAWMIQDSVIEMQQNGRAAIDELARQIRMTGYGIPNGATPMITVDGNPDSIFVYYEPENSCEVTLEQTMSSYTENLRCTGHDVSCFSVGQQVYIYDPNLESGEFFTISGLNTGTGEISHSASPLSRNYPQTSIIKAVDEIVFYVDEADTSHPCLMIRVGNNSPQVYAEDITDLQFTYTLKNGITVNSTTMVRDVRQVGVKITARTTEPDVEMTESPYRDETYQSKVYLRNLGT